MICRAAASAAEKPPSGWTAGGWRTRLKATNPIVATTTRTRPGVTGVDLELAAAPHRQRIAAPMPATVESFGAGKVGLWAVGRAGTTVARLGEAKVRNPAVHTSP